MITSEEGMVFITLSFPQEDFIQTNEFYNNIEDGLQKVADEYLRARRMFGPSRSMSEAMGVLQEEVYEVWDAKRENDLKHWREELIQVAAVAMGAAVEVGNVG